MTIHLPAIGPDLPTHPATGLRAIGMSKRGPIWPIFGASDDDTDTDAVDDADDQDDAADEGDKPEGADKLGDPGKRALDSMKAKWQKERDARKALEAQIATQNAKKGDDDKLDPDAIREQARAEARAEATRERALDKIEVKAAKLFADPEDAVALLGRRVDDFIDNGKVDLDAIEEALDDLLDKKPHLAAKSGDAPKGKAPKPDRSQGSRGGSGNDLDALIAEAQKAGDYKRVISLQNRKLAAASK